MMPRWGWGVLAVLFIIVLAESLLGLWVVAVINE